MPEATLGWADSPPTERLEVVFLPEAEQQILKLPPEHYPQLRPLIEDLVGYDPRPSFRRGREEDRIYGAHLYDLNVRFRFVNDHSRKRVEVLTVC